MHYIVVYEQGPHNASAYVPELPVVVVTAPSVAELAQCAREAIAFHLWGSTREAAAVTVELVPVYTGPVTTLAGDTVPAEPDSASSSTL